MAAKDKTSEKDRVLLERAKNDYDAIKQAKKYILVKNKKEALNEQFKKDDGATELEAETSKLIESLDEVSRKQEEFPEDEEINVDVEVAETLVDVIALAS